MEVLQTSGQLHVKAITGKTSRRINDASSLPLPYLEAELAEVVNAWPELSESVRNRILLLVKSAQNTK